MTVKSRRRAASSMRHRRIAGDGEPLVAAARLRLAPRQRDVDVADLEDLKAFADRLDAADRFEQRPQAIGGQAEHLEVDVLRRLAEQPIAHPAADDERAPAGVADGARDLERPRRQAAQTGFLAPSL